MKGELANENLNHDTKTKAYVPVWARSVSYQKKGSPGEIWTGFRSSRLQMFFKIGVLKKFLKFHRKTPVIGDTYWLSCNPEDSIKKRLQNKCFPVNLQNFSIQDARLFFEEHTDLHQAVNTFFYRTAPVAASDV